VALSAGCITGQAEGLHDRHHALVLMLQDMAVIEEGPDLPSRSKRTTSVMRPGRQRSFSGDPSQPRPPRLTPRDTGIVS